MIVWPNNIFLLQEYPDMYSLLLDGLVELNTTILIIEGLSLLQSIPPTTANKQTQASWSLNVCYYAMKDVGRVWDRKWVIVD